MLNLQLEGAIHGVMDFAMAAEAASFAAGATASDGPEGEQ
jgi:hypothetical protein